MIKPARDIVYGVCDKTGNCDSYFGFFKNEDDAKKEVKIQADRMKEDFGYQDITVKDDRAVIMKTDRIEEVLIIIRSYVLR
jgi:hypothetical protein